MRNAVKWLLPLAWLASALPAAQAWHHHYGVAPVPVVGAPLGGFGGQSFGVQSYALPSYAVQALPVQSYGMQSYSLVPVGSQGLEAQGFGTDLGSLLLSRLLGGGLNPGTTGGSSDVVRELQNNTAALKDNTAALKALTQAVKDNTTSPSNTSNPIGQLPQIPGVTAHALQAAQAAYAQDLMEQYASAQGLATKPAPATNTDILSATRAQIKAANDAVLTARLYLNAATTRNASDTDEIKYLNDQLKKIGIGPASAPDK